MPSKRTIQVRFLVGALLFLGSSAEKWDTLARIVGIAWEPPWVLGPMAPPA